MHHALEVLGPAPVLHHVEYQIKCIRGLDFVGLTSLHNDGPRYFKCMILIQKYIIRLKYLGLTFSNHVRPRHFNRMINKFKMPDFCSSWAPDSLVMLGPGSADV